ncbi:hypothetical protein T484DRAFT_1985583 [Baffinella frigidus]|nr:hypothetical protein T484DRAFT_1985583 [Cryptophyta sp. CCMP2293]
MPPQGDADDARGSKRWALLERRDCQATDRRYSRRDLASRWPMRQAETHLMHARRAPSGRSCSASSSVVLSMKDGSGPSGMHNSPRTEMEGEAMWLDSTCCLRRQRASRIAVTFSVDAMWWRYVLWSFIETTDVEWQRKGAGEAVPRSAKMHGARRLVEMRSSANIEMSVAVGGNGADMALSVRVWFRGDRMLLRSSWRRLVP